jgi:hypothetical protein
MFAGVKSAHRCGGVGPRPLVRRHAFARLVFF